MSDRSRDVRPRIAWRLTNAGRQAVLRVALPDRASVVALRNLFQRVGKLGFGVSLAEEPRMDLGNIAAIELRRSDIRPRKGVLRTNDGGIIWSCTAEGWLTNVAMLEPFKRGQRGHQYLTDDDADDALVEVSFGEDAEGAMLPTRRRIH